MPPPTALGTSLMGPVSGGQPSDEGAITTDTVTFNVSAVRMDVVNDGQVLHLGRYSTPDSHIKPGETVTQNIDSEKRNLYSRLHTAGHCLGAAVRQLLEKEIPKFDELKASHFPDSAACEFQGLIEGKWKEPIQKQLDDIIRKNLPVEIDWWGEEDFRANGLERLIPEKSMAGPGEKLRIVKIVGAEVYPCGGRSC